ncbi:MAG: MmcQ/YjbR family DNA-binding protein [Thermoanaerobaculia bacterium]
MSVTHKSATLRDAESRLRELALAFPEVYEELPWGHRAMKVRKKAFAFIALDEEGLSLSLKLPASGVMALALPFASPTGYGLGKSGWVTCRFAEGDEIPFELLAEWLDESYRAIAPKKLAAKLAGPD